MGLLAISHVFLEMFQKTVWHNEADVGKKLWETSLLLTDIGKSPLLFGSPCFIYGEVGGHTLGVKPIDIWLTKTTK